MLESFEQAFGGPQAEDHTLITAGGEILIHEERLQVKFFHEGEREVRGEHTFAHASLATHH